MFSLAFVEPPGDRVELGFRVDREVNALREVLPQEPVGIFVRSALPGTLGIAEVNLDIGGQREALVIRHLLAAIPGERPVELVWQLLGVLDERIDDRFCVLARNLRKHHVARVTLNQRRDLAVLAAEQQITFPVTGHGTVFSRGRTLADRDGVRDLTVNRGLLRVMPRATHPTRAPQMLRQLLLQSPTGLDEEAAIDRLV